jgi:hypothetical protein
VLVTVRTPPPSTCPAGLGELAVMTVMDSDSPVWTDVSVERGIKEGLGLGGGAKLAGGGRAETLGKAEEEGGNAAGAGGGTEDDGGGGSGTWIVEVMTTLVTTALES